jgi:hypothetical protein
VIDFGEDEGVEEGVLDTGAAIMIYPRSMSPE